MHVCRVTVAASACQQPCLHESERTAAARPFNPPPLLRKFLCSGCCPSCVNVEAFDSTSFISPLLLRLLAGTEGWSDGVRSVPKDGVCWNKEQQWLTGETHTACLMLYVRQRQLFALSVSLHHSYHRYLDFSSFSCLKPARTKVQRRRPRGWPGVPPTAKILSLSKHKENYKRRDGATTGNWNWTKKKQIKLTGNMSHDRVQKEHLWESDCASTSCGRLSVLSHF